MIDLDVSSLHRLRVATDRHPGAAAELRRLQAGASLAITAYVSTVREQEAGPGLKGQTDADILRQPPSVFPRAVDLYVEVQKQVAAARRAAGPSLLQDPTVELSSDKGHRHDAESLERLVVDLSAAATGPADRVTSNFG